MMNYQDKTKPELLKELQKLQQECDSLKTLYDKELTSNKQVEDVLKINEALFREYYNHMKSGSAIFKVINDGSTGSDYIIEKINRIGLELEGKTLEEVVGKRFIDIRPTIDNYGLISVMKKVWETGESAIFPARLYIDELHSNYYENYVFKLPSGEIVTLYDDVTESKKLEEALRREKENFRNSRDYSPLGIRIVSHDGNTIYANQAFLDLFGYENIEELKKGHLKDLYTAESYVDSQKRKLDRDQDDFSRSNYEVSIVRKGGSCLTLLVFRKNVLWNGQTNSLVIYEDITERKHAEEELNKTKINLVKLNQHISEIREEERAFIAREIHDQLGQSLTSLKFDLGTLVDKTDSGSKEYVKLAELVEVVTHIIRDVQRISSELRPPAFDELGLSAAIEWYCDEFAERTGLQIRLELDNVQTENMNKNLALYRVLQESLTNVIRHAGAKNVFIKLCILGEDVLLIIKDDGIGITPDKINSFKSLGILGMFERIKQYGGVIEIGNLGKKGTEVKVRLSVK